MCTSSLLLVGRFLQFLELHSYYLFIDSIIYIPNIFDSLFIGFLPLVGIVNYVSAYNTVHAIPDTNEISLAIKIHSNHISQSYILCKSTIIVFFKLFPCFPINLSISIYGIFMYFLSFASESFRNTYA